MNPGADFYSTEFVGQTPADAVRHPIAGSEQAERLLELAAA
jgi:hypothetical protein